MLEGMKELWLDFVERFIISHIHGLFVVGCLSFIDFDESGNEGHGRHDHDMSRKGSNSFCHCPGYLPTCQLFKLKEWWFAYSTLAYFGYDVLPPCM